jgi:predicted metalloprotease with PDZ domain
VESVRRIEYVVSSPHPEHHLLHVEATFRGPLEEPLEVALPVWTPGSYLVREYARHLERPVARTALGPVGLHKVRKNAWAVAHGGRDAVTFSYDLYAQELSVRSSHADRTHLRLNGPSTFARPVSEPAWSRAPCAVRVVPPRDSWAVSTALERAPDGAFLAEDYETLADSPFEVGEHRVFTVNAAGRAHELAVWGGAPGLDGDRLTADVARVLERAAALYGDVPYDRYVFQLYLAPGLRGGLEHRNGAALMASPDAFETEEGYHDLLALFAHEYLHLWHVRRVRPEGLFVVDFDRENHTRQLWLFEGGASYYDWLLLVREGLATPQAYLRHLSGELARLEDTPGRLVQSLEDASFDAWTRLYRPDENTHQSTVSYYVKGELVCALLDLELLLRTDGRRSLDDVLRHLWTDYGRAQRPVPEGGLEAVFAAATDCDVSDLLDQWVRQSGELPCAAVLRRAGLGVGARPGRGAALGVRVRVEGGRLFVAAVLRGGAGHAAGLSPGDEVLALAGRRVDEHALRERLRRGRPGTATTLTTARRERVQEVPVTLQAPPPEPPEVHPRPDATAEEKRLAVRWLGPAAARLWPS